MDIIITAILIAIVGYFVIRNTRSVSMDRAIRDNMKRRADMREALDKQKKITKTKEQEYEDAKNRVIDAINKSDE